MEQIRTGYLYQELDRNDVLTEVKNLFIIWNNYINDHISPRKLSKEFRATVDGSTLAKVVRRVDITREYYKRFHDTSIAEYKVAALYAYWINKLKPVFVYNKELGEKINATFSLYLFYAGIRKKGKIREHIDFEPNSEYIKHLLYAMQYDEITEKSMMLIGEAIKS